MYTQASNVSDAPAAHNSSVNNAVRFDEAVKNLSEAIAERKVEPICTAYLALPAANGEIPHHEIIERVDRAVTSKFGSAREIITSAFSHRRCVMCNDGVIPCRTCNGDGTVNDYPCPECETLGVEICLFCMGTGWCDHHDMPSEIHPDAVIRRIKHTKKDLATLDRMSEANVLASADKLQPKQRRELASRLLRLRARLTQLAGVEVGDDTEHVARFRIGAARIKRFIEALRAEKPPPEEKQQT